MFGKTKKRDCPEAAVIAGLQGSTGSATFDQALACLNQTCKQPIRRWLVQHGASEMDAEDLYQDALVELLLLLERGATVTTTACGFLFGIARNLCLRKLRNHVREEKLKETLKAEAPKNGLDILPTGLIQQDDIVQTCWKQLGERCQSILTDYYQNGHAFEQIANSYGYASAHAARQTKLRCLKQLRDCVGDQTEPDNLFFDFP